MGHVTQDVRARLCLCAAWGLPQGPGKGVGRAGSAQHRTPFTDVLSHFWGPGSPQCPLPWDPADRPPQLLRRSSPAFTCHACHPTPPSSSGPDIPGIRSSPAWDKSLLSVQQPPNPNPHPAHTPHPLLSPSRAPSTDLESHNLNFRLYLCLSYWVTLSNTWGFLSCSFFCLGKKKKRRIAPLRGLNEVMYVQSLALCPPPSRSFPF